MKGIISSCLLLFTINAFAQSPYLSILVKMDSVKAESTRYKIEMKICEPKKMTERGDWFTHDTSTINFASLKENEIECGKYFDNGMPTLISGEEEKKINQFEFGNQVFAWEKIFVFAISDQSSRGWNPPMFILMPMKYKSFVTKISLTNIQFQSGKVIFLNDYMGSIKGMNITIEESLQNKNGKEVKSFPLRSILEDK
jgi:hypothetical protein